MEKIWEESQDQSGKVALSEQPKPFTLHCLGRFALLRHGIPVIFTREKARELLAFLACEEGRPVSKASVAAALWPRQGEAQAMDSLYKICRYLNELTRRGEAPPLSAVRGRLWLDLHTVDCDILTFQAMTAPSASMEELRQAVERYRAPLLVEEGYEWTDRLEGFYDMRYLDAVERLWDHAKKLGRQKESDYYRRLLDL